MSYSKLSILKPGQTFRVGECLCILLEHGKGELEGTTKVLIIENTWTTQPVMMEQPFDAHESNYKLSELRKDIESWDNQGWIEYQVGTENLVEHTCFGLSQLLKIQKEARQAHSLPFFFAHFQTFSRKFLICATCTFKNI